MSRTAEGGITKSSVKGTAGYIAPEVLEGVPASAKADLFGMGLILWEILTGQRLFDGETEAVRLRKTLQCHVPDPAEAGANVSPDVMSLLRQLLAREPDDRFLSAGAARQAVLSAPEGRTAGHAVLPDGVFGQTPAGEFEFVELSAPADPDVEAVGLSIVKGILKLLLRRAEAAQEAGDDDEAMTQALTEAVLSGAAPKSTLGDGPRKPKRRATLIRTELGLFSFHADTHVAQGNRAGFGKAAQVLWSPGQGACPFSVWGYAHKRLSLLPSGKVSYKLRKAYFTGQTEVVLEPVAFLRRLAALVPAGSTEPNPLLRTFGIASR